MAEIEDQLGPFLGDDEPTVAGHARLIDGGWHVRWANDTD